MDYKTALMLARKKDDLPAGYRRVKYLESSGTQYIDTGVLSNKDNEFLLKFSIPSISNNFLFGYMSNVWGVSGNYCSLNAVRRLLYCYAHDSNYYPITVSGTFSNIQADRICTLACGNTYLRLECDGVSSEVTKEIPANYKGIFTGRMFLFGINGGNGAGGATARFKGKGYQFSVSRLGEILINYIPLVREEDDKPCMYDTVNKDFHFNNGTGEFGWEELNGTYVAPISGE